MRFEPPWAVIPFGVRKTAVLAVEKLLKKTGLAYEQIDAFEVNEAFAVIDVLFERAFLGTRERYNRFGGALAYGHPYGVSGALLLLHLLKSLESCDGHYGICSVAAAGGDRQHNSGGADIKQVDRCGRRQRIC